MEQLAACSDQNTQNFKGLITLKQNAQAYLDAANGRDAKYEELTNKQEQLTQMNVELMEMNKALIARIEELEQPKPKRKRRTKAEMEAEKQE